MLMYYYQSSSAQSNCLSLDNFC